MIYIEDEIVNEYPHAFESPRTEYMKQYNDVLNEVEKISISLWFTIIRNNRNTY